MQVKMIIVWIECQSNSGDDDDDGDNIEDMEEDDDGDGITNEGKIEFRRYSHSVISNSQMILTTTEMTFLMKKRRLTMTMMTTALTMKLTKMTTMMASSMLVSRVVQ